MIDLCKIIVAGLAVALTSLAAASTPAAAQSDVGFATAPAAALGGPTDDKKDFMTDLVQSIEGRPNPNGDGRCGLVRQPVLNVHGDLVGYHTFNVCR